MNLVLLGAALRREDPDAVARLARAGAIEPIAGATTRAETGILKRSFAFATAPASAARSAAGTDTWRRLAPSPNASLQLLLLNSSAMYNTG